MNPMAAMNLKAMKQLAVESFVESSILLLPDFAHASDANGPKRTSASHLRLVAMYFQLYEHVLKCMPPGLHAWRTVCRPTRNGGTIVDAYSHDYYRGYIVMEMHRRLIPRSVLERS